MMICKGCGIDLTCPCKTCIERNPDMVQWEWVGIYGASRCPECGEVTGDSLGEKVKRWRELAQAELFLCDSAAALREAAAECERLQEYLAKSDAFTIALLDKYEPNRVIRTPEGKYVHRMTGEPG